MDFAIPSYIFSRNAPRIRTLWLDIRIQIKSILHIDLLDFPIHFLLNVPTILISSRDLFPVYWKSPQVPSRTNWIKKVTDIMEAEKWMATFKWSYENFDAIWATWIYYSSLAFSTLRLLSNLGRRALAAHFSSQHFFPPAPTDAMHVREVL